MALPAPFSTIADQANLAVQSAGRKIAVMVAMGLMAVIGFGFLLAALFIWLAAELTPLHAALIIGLAFLLIVGVWLLAVTMHNREIKRRRAVAMANSATIASTLTLANTGLNLASRVRGGLLVPAAATILIGWYLMRPRRVREPRLRR